MQGSNRIATCYASLEVFCFGIMSVITPYEASLCSLFPAPGRSPSIRALSSTEKLSYWEPFSDCNSDDWMQIAGMMDTLRKQVISPLKNTVRSEGCRISKVHKEVRHALAGSVSGEGFD